MVHVVVRTDNASNVRCSAADALEKPFAGTAAAEKDKVTEYAADIVPGVAFSPFGCGTQGELGKHAIFSVKRLAKEIARRRNGGEIPKGPEAVAAVRMEIRRRLGVKLMQGQAAQILAWVTKDRPRAVAHLSRMHVHTAHRVVVTKCDCGKPRGFGCACIRGGRR